MARIHLVVGPVGSGKSTFSRELCAQHGAVPLTLDAWFTRLFSPDRPDEGVIFWYRERAARCVEQIRLVAMDILAADTDVVLEIGLVGRREREAFVRKVEAAGAALTIYIVDAPREVRRERVMRRNAERGETFSMHVPEAVFEMASDMWEPLDEHECAGRDVRVV